MNTTDIDLSRDSRRGVGSITASSDSYVSWLVDGMAVISTPVALRRQEDITRAIQTTVVSVARNLLKKMAQGKKFSGKSYLNRRNRKRYKK